MVEMASTATRQDQFTKHVCTRQSLVTLPANVVGAFGNCIEYLDLSHNRIADLGWIYALPNLNCLILDCNRLRESHFQRLLAPLRHIKVLMLNKNELDDLGASVAILCHLFPNLEYLSLHGNPICPDGLELQPFCQHTTYGYDYYRTYILSAFRRLRFLDHTDARSELRQFIPKENMPRLFNFTPRMLWTKLKGTYFNGILPICSRYQNSARITSNLENKSCVSDQDL